MFEQTFLTQPPATQKTGALFLSLAAQILICGVLIIAPLVFTDVLPMLHIAKPEIFVVPEPPKPLPPILRAVTRTTVRTFNPFMAPTHVPQRLVSEISVDAPFVPAEVGAASVPVLPAIGIDPSAASYAPAPPKPAVVEAAAPKPVVPEIPVRVSGGAQLAKLIKQVVPNYPEPAHRFRISGTVKLLGIIAKDGRVRDLRVLSGHPLLQRAALDAVSQWIYNPTILSGQPVEVEAPIDVIFEIR